MAKDNAYVAWFDHLDSGDVEKVGGKNASLGEMIKRLKKAGIRVPDGFDDLKVALSVGVQKMVRSDKAGSGVMFSIDTDTFMKGS